MDVQVLSNVMERVQPRFLAPELTARYPFVHAHCNPERHVTHTADGNLDNSITLGKVSLEALVVELHSSVPATAVGTTTGVERREEKSI